MPGVPMQCTGAGGQDGFKWKVITAGPVMRNVICLKYVPMKPRTKTVLKFIVALAIFIVASLRVYREFVPAGANPIPYLGYSVDGGKITAPGGTSYNIRFNDAGGMHSGNHWTWVVKCNLLTGRYVEIAGYLGPEYAVDREKIPVQWDGELPVLPFRTGRYE